MAITRGQAFKQDTARWTGAVLILLGSGIVVEVTRRAFSVGVALKVRRRMRTASCTYRPRSFVSKERKRLSKVSYLALLIIMSWYQFTRSLHGSRTLFSPDTNVRVPRNAVRAETLGRNAVGRRRREYHGLSTDCRRELASTGRTSAGVARDLMHRKASRGRSS